MLTETIAQRPSGITFDVHDVQPTHDVLTKATTLEVLSALIGEGHGIDDCSGKLEQLVYHFNWDWVQPPPAHALMGAIHLAFAKHRPLVLTPDAVWITIAQGVGNLQRMEDESGSPDKLPALTVDGYYGPETRWEDLVDALVKRVVEDLSRRDFLKLGSAAAYLCDFSTTGPRELVASGVALLKAYEARFEVHPKCICGIPKVTLEGSVEDWEKVRSKAKALVKDGVWKSKLLPILDQFIAAAKGLYSRDFWKDIYKLEKGYGIDWANGWSTMLFPYLTGTGSQESSESISPATEWQSLSCKRVSNAWLVKNPMVYGWHDGYKQPQRMDMEAMQRKPELDADGNRIEKMVKVNGVYCGHFPHALCSIQFLLKASASPQEVMMEVAAGLIGIKEDSSDLSLKPVAGWAVRKASC